MARPSPTRPSRAIAAYPLAEGQGETSIAGTAIDYNAYGGWLQHSFFVVEVGRIAEGLFKNTPIIHSYSVGDAANTNPVVAGGSGTWSGVMVGADVSQTSTRGNLIQGNAEITIADFADPQADIAFTQIFDLNTKTQRGDMSWSDIEVTAGGFASGADGESIEGRFYGPSHQEVGGFFEPRSSSRRLRRHTLFKHSVIDSFRTPLAGPIRSLAVYSSETDNLAEL